MDVCVVPTKKKKKFISQYNGFIHDTNTIIKDLHKKVILLCLDRTQKRIFQREECTAQLIKDFHEFKMSKLALIGCF